jgi:hypothetical protein
MRPHLLCSGTKIRECYMNCYAWCLKAGMTIEPEKMEVLFFNHPWPNLMLQGTHPLTIYLLDWGLNTYYAVTASNHV